MKLLSICSLLYFSCNNTGNTGDIVISEETNNKPRIQAPPFNADTAFYFLEKQISFGTRVPNTEPHRQCGAYLVETLKKLGAEVQTQDLEIRAYNRLIPHSW